MSIGLSVVCSEAINQMFRGLSGVMDKAAAHAAEKEIEESVILNWRLAPDMFPLIRQIQIATEIPARTLSRLAGAELPSFSDDETTFAELQTRIEKAKSIVAGLSKEALDADPEGPITFPVGPKDITLPRRAFVQHFILPNLYFHVAAAYMILRHTGVEVGKRDYLAVPGL